MEDVQAVAGLVRRCVAGDAAAWEEIVRQYQRRIYNLCYRFTGSGDEAEDLTQEVFIKMYRSLSSYDVERGAFVSWITTLTRNLLVDHFRKSRQERLTDSLDAAPQQDEGEDVHLRLVTPDQLRALIRDGTIRHALALATWFLVQEHL